MDNFVMYIREMQKESRRRKKIITAVEIVRVNWSPYRGFLQRVVMVELNDGSFEDIWTFYPDEYWPDTNIVGLTIEQAEARLLSQAMSWPRS